MLGCESPLSANFPLRVTKEQLPEKHYGLEFC